MQFFSASNWLFNKTFFRNYDCNYCRTVQIKLIFKVISSAYNAFILNIDIILENLMKRIELGHVFKIVWTRITEKEHHLFLSPILHDTSSIATMQYQFRRLWMTLIAFLLTAKSCSSEVFHTENRQSGWQWEKKSISQSAGNGISKTTAGVSQYDKCGNMTDRISGNLTLFLSITLCTWASSLHCPFVRRLHW